MKTVAAAMSKQQFDELFMKVSNWGVWCAEDERGLLTTSRQRRLARHRAGKDRASGIDGCADQQDCGA